MKITATTRLCGLIGDPVAHSFSPAMHNAAFAYLGLDYAYVAMLVTDVPTAIAGARALDFVGLNVTAPHKQTAFAYCEPDQSALNVGVVNTLLFAEGKVRGTNTDVYGVDCALSALGPSPKRAVVAGTGGAARAAFHALTQRGAEVTVVSRSARTLGKGAQAISYGDAAEAFAHADVVVDATPLGLGDGPPAWSVAALGPNARVLDLVVKASTPLTRAAEARGLVAHTGKEMLLYQGIAAFETFVGQPAPRDVMRAALENALMEAT